MYPLCEHNVWEQRIYNVYRFANIETFANLGNQIFFLSLADSKKKLPVWNDRRATCFFLILTLVYTYSDRSELFIPIDEKACSCSYSEEFLFEYQTSTCDIL